jgi:hypothetical protein
VNVKYIYNLNGYALLLYLLTDGRCGDNPRFWVAMYSATLPRLAELGGLSCNHEAEVTGMTSHRARVISSF